MTAIEANALGYIGEFAVAFNPFDASIATGTDRSCADGVARCGLLRRFAATVCSRVLAASHVVLLENLEALALLGQGHHGRAGSSLRRAARESEGDGCGQRSNEEPARANE